MRLELNKKDIKIACPKGPVKGALFRNSDNGKIYVYNGKKWIRQNPFHKEWNKCCEKIGRSIGKCIAEFYESPEIIEAFEKFMKRKKLKSK